MSGLNTNKVLKVQETYLRPQIQTPETVEKPLKGARFLLALL